MQTITIYTTPFCPYCTSAKLLLQRKNAPFTEIDVADDPAVRRRLVTLSGGKTSVPQIFIGARHIGGCDELYALEDAGELDALLAG
jgi:glutaredoxin 3